MAEYDVNDNGNGEDPSSNGDWLWPFKWLLFWCVLAPFVVIVISFLVCLGNGGIIGN